MEAQFRHEEQDDLETEQHEQERHLDHERHRMDSSRRIRASHVLDNGSEDDERGTRPERDERIEERENVLVVDERRNEHRNRCRYGRDGNQPRLYKVLGRLGRADGADHVADSREDKRPLEQRRTLGPRHVLRNHDDELRNAPERRDAEHRKPEHGIRPSGRKIAYGGAELDEAVTLAHADRE